MKLSKPHLKGPLSSKSSGVVVTRASGRDERGEPATVIVVRTEKRSWLALAVTGFGAVLLRYIRTVRERGRILRLRK